MINDVKATRGSSCAPLLRLATPEIYRRNSFRVLGLPIDVEPREAQRQLNRRRMLARLGRAAAESSSRPLALEPPPTEEEARSAMDRLHRPIERILDELFWFWPTNGASDRDPALAALATGDIAAAQRHWKMLGASGNQVATHNLAVLDHLRALDGEACRLAEQRSDDDLEEIWLRAFGGWREVCEGEGFWDAARHRIRDLDDVQLTTGFLQRVRATLPTALLLISAKIASMAAERAQEQEVRRHLSLIRESAFGDGLAEQAIRESLRPVRARLDTALDSARRRWRRAPHRGNLYVRELYGQAVKLLPVIDLMLAEDDLARSSLRDKIAEAMLVGQVAYGSKTNDWRESIEILELAKSVAVSSDLQSKLDENLEILEGNAEAGNDWCAAGYWELDEGTIAELERARERSVAGGHEQAIEILLALDPAIGTPLRRCVAFCLSQHCWGLTQTAFEELNAPTKKLTRFLEVLEREGTISVPSPEMNSWEVPSCPSCASSDYTSWVNGEYQGQRFWMCAGCSARDDAERSDRRSIVRKKLTEALEHLLLALKLDPQDSGLLKEKETLTKIANEFGVRKPKTTALKRRLSGRRTRAVAHRFDALPAHRSCHFCGAGSADPAFEIRVPLCGDPKPTEFLFDSGLEYRFGSYAVPRCRRCRDAHRELPERRGNWNRARREAMRDELFPEAVAEVARAMRVAEVAEEGQERAQKGVAEARAVIAAAAEAAGSECDRCGLSKPWTGLFCRRCDRSLLTVSPWLKFAVVAAAILAITVQTPAAIVPIVVFGVLATVLKIRQVRRRRILSEQRREEVERRKETAVREVQSELDEALAAKQQATAAFDEARQDAERALRKLKRLKRQAAADFESFHRPPALEPGVMPEGEYVAFGPLDDLLASGWHLGSELDAEGEVVSDEVVEVKGLVSREVEIDTAVH